MDAVTITKFKSVSESDMPSIFVQLFNVWQWLEIGKGHKQSSWSAFLKDAAREN